MGRGTGKKKKKNKEQDTPWCWYVCGERAAAVGWPLGAPMERADGARMARN